MPANTAPTLANLAGENPAYTEDGAPVRPDVGGNGPIADPDPFVALFSSGATETRIAALVQALTYASTNQNPAAARPVTVNDGSGTAGGGQNSTTVTVNVATAATDDPPVAVADSAAVAENATVAIAVVANDTDPDGGARFVTAVNGAAVTAGTVVPLASGARVTLNGDGTLTYDPNGAYNSLTTPGSGAVNTFAGDSFSYALNGGSSATVTVTVSGVTGPGDVLLGNSSANTITGSAADETIDGRGGNDVLIGGGGNDVLIGGSGVDELRGGTGNDFFYVDSGGDKVIEQSGEGFDRVFASTDYQLDTNAEIEMLTTDFNPGSDPINLTGNRFNNFIYGNNGRNVLRGLGGTDSLIGFGGNDEFYVDSADDYVLETENGGTDRIYSSVSYILGAGIHVETLTTNDNLARTSINLTGNELVNQVYGNAGRNVLDGGGGADLLVGFSGDDMYYVDHADDRVFERDFEGFDRVFASVDYTLGSGFEAHIEMLTTDFNPGTAAIDLTGNEFVNWVYGNAGANILNGKGGADSLTGFEGADTFVFDTDLGDSNVDYLSDFASGTDRIQLSRSVFAALASGPLPAGALVAGTAAQDADDRIVYDAASGRLFYDADGSGAEAAVQFALLRPGTALAAADFIVA